jgi:hypothetical protein
MVILFKRDDSFGQRAKAPAIFVGVYLVKMDARRAVDEMCENGTWPDACEALLLDGEGTWWELNHGAEPRDASMWVLMKEAVP